jgi:hypothetical protein
MKPKADCNCKPSRPTQPCAWVANAGMSSAYYNVWIATDACVPPDTLLTHENRHVKNYNDAINKSMQLAKEVEGAYQDEGACKTACEKFQYDVLQTLLGNALPNQMLDALDGARFYFMCLLK